MNIDKYIPTKNQDLNVTYSSEIQANASVVELLSDKSNQIAVQGIVDEVYRSKETNCATITDTAQDNPTVDVQQIQIIDDVSTGVPNISDPATWPLTRNSKII